MKRFSILMMVAFAMSFVASAEIVSDVVLCRVQVNSGTKGTILSIPMAQVGAETAQVDLSRIVMTENIENGSVLIASYGEQQFFWVMKGGAWESVKSVSEAGVSDSAGITGISRGAAFWIERAGGQEAWDKPFYLYGQLGDRMTSTQQIAAAVENNEGEIIPAYTRIGNPNPEDRDINALTWTNVQEGDLVVWGNKGAAFGAMEYRWNGSQWGYDKPVTTEVVKKGKTYTKVSFVWEPAPKLPAGQGFWYIRKSTSSATVQF